jgi:hypothetical protein
MTPNEIKAALPTDELRRKASWLAAFVGRSLDSDAVTRCVWAEGANRLTLYVAAPVEGVIRISADLSACRRPDERIEPQSGEVLARADEDCGCGPGRPVCGPEVHEGSGTIGRVIGTLLGRSRR